jgi:hypothetical protein
MSRLSSIPLLALTLLPLEPAAAQVSLGLLPTQGAGTNEPGRRLTFVCAAGTGANARVYGTDVYTVDSAVCPAAIHAGVLKPNVVGVVTILTSTGAKVFRGSTRNGVSTQSYGAWPYSFTFVDDGKPGSITWRTTWSQIPAEFSEPIALVCPPAGQVGVVWGTGVYSRDSSICTAAVHAGLIRPDTGGAITVERATNAAPFSASDKFGVKSAAWSAQPDAFTVMSASATTRIAGAIAASPEAAPRTTAINRAPPNLSGKQVKVRNTEPLSLTVAVGTDVLISWPAVPGAAYYGVAGATEGLWRQVQAPSTTVVYQGLGPGEYTFAVGAYFEPGPVTTPVAEWQRVRVTILSEADERRILDNLNKAVDAQQVLLDAISIRP